MSITQFEEIKSLLLQKNIHSKDIMSFKEAVIYMDVSQSFLYKLTSENRIKFSKPSGKLIYFKKSDLDDWMLSNKSRPVQEMESDILSNLKNGRYE